jgi:hypothetical protein
MRLHPTKAIWKFPDGNIEGAGPANSYLVPYKDKTAQLVISIAMVIARGTGRYEGARGTISSLGATWFPFIPGLPLQKSLRNGALFEARGVHAFRISLSKYQAEPVEECDSTVEDDDITDVDPDCDDDIETDDGTSDDSDSDDDGCDQ